MNGTINISMVAAAHEATRESRPQFWVAYYDHETNPDHTDELANEHFKELAEAGFTGVVFCVTESDLASPERMAQRRRDVEQLHALGLQVLADPWGVAWVFGGKYKAKSLFYERGERCCAACNPRVTGLVQEWVWAARSLNVDGIFVDEPEMQCHEHGDGREDLAFIMDMVQYAGELGLFSTVCLCANPNKLDLFDQVAALPNVVSIGVDPYVPNPWDKNVTRAKYDEYALWWFCHVVGVARMHNKESHGWGQLFGKAADLALPAETVRAATRARLGAVAFWAQGANVAFERFRREDGAAHQQALWTQTLGEVRETSGALVLSRSPIMAR